MDGGVDEKRDLAHSWGRGHKRTDVQRNESDGHCPKRKATAPIVIRFLCFAISSQDYPHQLKTECAGGKVARAGQYCKLSIVPGTEECRRMTMTQPGHRICPRWLM